MRATALSLLLACGDAPPPATTAAPTEPVRPVAHLTRLRATAWAASIEALTGVRYDGTLPETERILGHESVGAAAAGVSALDEEQYEAAAWSVAQRMAPPRCAFAATPAHATPAYEALVGCVEADLADLAWRAWRRPLRASELEALTQVWRGLRYEVGDELGLRAARAAVLASPHFLYEVASGQPTSDGSRRLNGYEVATRVAFALTGRGPSTEWLLEASSGGFDTSEGIRAHVDAALAEGAATGALTAYWRELFDIDLVATVAKDSERFPTFDAPLRAALASEFDALVQAMVLAPDADTRDLFTTDWVPDDPLLRGLYALGDGANHVDTARGGVLGRGAFAAVASHATTTSPTRRGLFILTRLLCEDIPPPPPGVVASLSAVADVPGTLRDKLQQHVSDPSCATCHATMDAAGFALEPVDAIGAWRTTDGGRPIEATVRLAGTDIDGPGAVGAWVAAHPSLARCLAADLWHHLTGADDRPADAVWIDDWAASWSQNWRWTNLIADALSSEALRSVEGGEGWVATETCNGADDDGDGTVDDLRRGCDAAGVAGVARCVGGAWTTCETRAVAVQADATCPGPSLGGVGVQAAVFGTTVDDLLRVHPSCEPAYTPAGRGCEIAADRLCAEASCGFGIGVVTARDAVPWVACASQDVVTPASAPWSELTALDPTCRPGEVDPGGCHRAFDAWCRANGNVGGWGPNLDNGDTAEGLCAKGGHRVGLAWGGLRFQGACDGWEGLPNGVCGEAAHVACQRAGYTTGWGPVASADGAHDVDVVCFGGEP